MSKPSRVRTLTILLAAIGTTLALSAGCAKQSEGERCGKKANGDLDCEDGLVCWTADELGLVDQGDDFGRCCPPRGEKIGDSRCYPRVGGGAGAGGSSSGGGSGTGGGSSATGGMTTSGGASAEGGATSTGGGSADAGSSSGGATTGGTEGA